MVPGNLGQPSTAGLPGVNGGVGGGVAPGAAGGYEGYSGQQGYGGAGGNFGSGGGGGYGGTANYYEAGGGQGGSNGGSGSPGTNGLSGGNGGSGSVGLNGQGGENPGGNSLTLVGGGGGSGGGGGGSGGGGGGCGSVAGGVVGCGEHGGDVDAGFIFPVTDAPGFALYGGYGGYGGEGEGTAPNYQQNGLLQAGSGATGGSGGSGGPGGDGGNGGGGGGAFEIIAQGQIIVGGQLLAMGANGAPGSPGGSGGAGTAGVKGHSAADPYTDVPAQNGDAGQQGTISFVFDSNGAPGGNPGAGGVVGGNNGGDGGVNGPGTVGGGGGGGAGGLVGTGGSSGAGGNGGSGASGGAGGGGAGGTVELIGSVVSTTGATVNTSGGADGNGSYTSSAAGQNGRFIFGTNSDLYAGNLIGASALVDTIGPVESNPFISGSPSTPTIPNLVGGAEAFGLTTLTPLAFGNFFVNAPYGTGAALYRVHLGPGAYGNDFTGYDALFLVNLSGSDLTNPQLGAGSGYLQSLLEGGFLNNTKFGGQGPQPLPGNVLPANGVYMTLVPATETTFNALYGFGGSLHGAVGVALANGGVIYLNDLHGPPAQTSYNLTDLAFFNPNANEPQPNGVIRDSSGNFFGTSYNGGSGAGNVGSIFEVSQGSSTPTDLANFQFGSGFASYPNGVLTEDSSGNLFGTTLYGGNFSTSSYGLGTVFEWVKSSGTITTLGSFDGTNGAYPTGGLVTDSNGDLFGTTSGYGSHPGTLFEWVKGTGTITSLASLSGFTGTLAIDHSTGDLFGTTGGGDANNDGTIFEWDPSTSSFTVLAAFNGTDGSAPQGGLLREANGDLFGTTTAGGADGNGTLFEWIKGTGTIIDIADLPESGPGANPGTLKPGATVLMDSNGNLFGFTKYGGGDGFGFIFEWNASTGTLNTIGTFTDSNGADPNSLVMDNNGNLYGTTPNGSFGGYLFQLTPNSPSISSLTVNTGPAGGGTTVTINGSNLAGAVAVCFGGVPGTIVSDNATQIIVTSPAERPGVGVGAVDVSVIAADGISTSTPADQFTYVKETPTITWTTPAGISYGTPLDSSELDATANASGTFSYTLGVGTSPASGALLSAGPNQTLNVTFTPADATEYNNATDQVAINVDPAAPTVGVSLGGTYDGMSVTASAVAYGVDHVTPVAGSFAFTYQDDLGSTLAAAPVSAGSYGVIATFTSSDPNYSSVSTVASPFTVYPAPLTIAANSETKDYGQSDPMLAYSVSGLLGSDTAATVLTGALTRAAGESVALGPYSITQGTLSTNSNYTIDFLGNSLTILPATLTITPDNQSKVYGAPLPVLTYRVSGFANGDSSSVLTGSLGTTATAASPVGTYPFTLGTLSAGANYSLQLAANSPTFSVIPASLTITPSPGQSRSYGASLPELTFSTSGFASGDGISLIEGALGTTSTAASPVGSYSITLGTLSAGGNYSLQLAANAPGFAVTPAAPSFSNLSAPVIEIGTESNTVISGHLQANAGQLLVPAAEEVDITLDGVSKTAPLDSNDDFSASFDIQDLMLAGSPYAIAFNYAGDGNFTAAPTGKSSLTVYTPLVILTNPSSQTFGAGEAVTLTAAARGFPVPAVQWEMSSDGTTFTPIPGATGGSYTFTAQTGENRDQFKAVFTNAGNSVTSRPATLIVTGQVPAGSVSPTSVSVAAGKSVSFTAQASGSPAPTVQWQVSVDGGNSFSNIGGATSATLTVTAPITHDGFQYRATFTNRWGSSYSQPATLTVTSATPALPVISLQPAGPKNAVSAGQRVTLQATALGATEVQWQISNDGVNFTPIVGATSTSYNFTALATMNGMNYLALFSNPFGETPTRAITLEVNPAVTAQPASQTVYAGQSATFTASAVGPGLSVQWQVLMNGVWTNIANGTSSSLSLISDTADNGNHYRAVFTSTVGTVTTQSTTQVAILTVRPLPAIPDITRQPVALDASAGQTVTFTAAAIANMPLSVQWQVLVVGGTWVDVANGTSDSLIFTAQLVDNGRKYRALFRTSAGSVVTSAVSLTVGTAPVVSKQPNDQTIAAGKTVTFSAAAQASPTARVQWQISIDGGHTFSNITGATGLALTFAAVATENGNLYRAVFTNAIGQATTTAAVLIV